MMATHLEKVTHLTFDVGGTVFDWHHGIRDEVEALAGQQGVPIDAAAFANHWRREMFRHLGEVRSGQSKWVNADELHRQALDDVVPQHAPFALDPAGRDQLNLVWHRLPAWPDFGAVLPRLRSRYTVSVLTVLSLALVVDSSKYNGLGWDSVISCEFLGHYKPDAAAYHAALRLLGTTPDRTMMVAAHFGDLRAAGAAGLASAYVPRPGEHGEGNDGDLSPQPDFTLNARDFGDLAEQLGV